MATSFDRLVTPKAFGALLDPPRTERTIYRWINEPGGLPVTELPGGTIRINLNSAWDYLKRREHQRVRRRQGRRANSVGEVA